MGGRLGGEDCVCETARDGDLGGRLGGEDEDDCESDAAGFVIVCGTLYVRTLVVRGGGGGLLSPGVELRERGRGLDSLCSNAIFLWKTMLPLRLLLSLPVVDGVCGDGGVSSFSGVAFLTGDTRGGAGDTDSSFLG